MLRNPQESQENFLIPPELAFSEQILAVPKAVGNSSISVFCALGWPDAEKERVQKLLGNPIDWIEKPPIPLRASIEEHYSLCYISSKQSEHEKKLQGNVQGVFTFLLEQARAYRASDIHALCGQGKYVIRFRIDSAMRTFAALPLSQGEALIRYIKLQAGMDISRTLRPVEGRLSYTGVLEESLDLRISLLPAVEGEKLTLRILEKEQPYQMLEQLGLPKSMLDALYSATHSARGLVIVCGPTGSGKTTSQYAFLRSLHDGSRHIISVEDPVEYIVPGITQIAATRQQETDFPTVLKWVLRQDPDVLMIGEIRDQETAHLALQAALTGHLVLSTLHTADSQGCIQRLFDLQSPLYLIADALQLIISQRLIKTLCPFCQKFPEKPIPKGPLCVAQHYRTGGCERCAGSGYYGRKAVFEMIRIGPQEKDLIRADQSRRLTRYGPSLAEQIEQMIARGETSYEEGMGQLLAGGAFWE